MKAAVAVCSTLATVLYLSLSDRYGGRYILSVLVFVALILVLVMSRVCKTVQFAKESYMTPLHTSRHASGTDNTGATLGLLLGFL